MGISKVRWRKLTSKEKKLHGKLTDFFQQELFKDDDADTRSAAEAINLLSVKGADPYVLCSYIMRLRSEATQDVTVQLLPKGMKRRSIRALRDRATRLGQDIEKFTQIFIPKQRGPIPGGRVGDWLLITFENRGPRSPLVHHLPKDLRAFGGMLDLAIQAAKVKPKKSHKRQVGFLTDYVNKSTGDYYDEEVSDLINFALRPVIPNAAIVTPQTLRSMRYKKHQTTLP